MQFVCQSRDLCCMGALGVWDPYRDLAIRFEKMNGTWEANGEP